MLAVRIHLQGWRWKNKWPYEQSSHSSVIKGLYRIFLQLSMREKYNINWLTNTFESGVPLNFLLFWGHTNKYNEATGNFCFSQWYPCPFSVDGITYNTAEHWMMAQKAILFEDEAVLKQIIACKTPAEAKKLGRRVLGFDEMLWNEKRYEIVKLGNIHKFNQHPAFAQYLLATGDKIIVESSPVDIIWGTGLPADHPEACNIYHWRGLNLLGFALMEVRDFFKNFGHFTFFQDALLPPWKKYPGIHPYDMFWRMGDGEHYLLDLYQYLDNLSQRDYTIYTLSYPPPAAWSNYYNNK